MCNKILQKTHLKHLKTAALELRFSQMALKSHYLQQFYTFQLVGLGISEPNKSVLQCPPAYPPRRPKPQTHPPGGHFHHSLADPAKLATFRPNDRGI